jgi:hypothetical protein
MMLAKVADFVGNPTMVQMIREKRGGSESHLGVACGAALDFPPTPNQARSQF